MLALNEWLNVDLFKLTFRHCSGSLMVILLFSGVAWIARHMMHEGYVLTCIEITDGVLIVGCILWLAIIMFREL